MRGSIALLWMLSATLAAAAPPVVTVPAEVTGEVGSFVAVRASVTESKTVKFVALDTGINLFPADLLADKTATVVTSGKSGRYRILCYSGNADGPSEPVTVTVVIGGAVAPVDPVKPDPVKPDPVVKVSKVSVVVIEESQTRTVKQGETLAALRKWADANGHVMFIVDKDDPTASKNGYLPLTTGGLPTVLVFDQGGKAGDKPLSVFKMPDGDAAIGKVKEVVK